MRISDWSSDVCSSDLAGCLDAIMPQGGQEGERAPAAVRRLADQPLASWGPTAQRSHVSFCPGLIDEDQTFGVDARLTRSPLPAAPGHVRAAFLSREGGDRKSVV